MHEMEVTDMVRCDLCGGEMCVEKRDMKFSVIRFKCKSCDREIEVDWIRIAAKPKSAYISAIIQALAKKGGRVYISAVGVRRTTMLDIVSIIRDVASIEETFIQQIDGRTMEFGFVLRKRGGNGNE